MLYVWRLDFEPYLTEVTNQPWMRPWLVEAGQPVSVPGVTNQQPHRPNSDHSQQHGPHQLQEETDPRPAEKLRQEPVKDSHGGTQEQKNKNNTRCSDVLIRRRQLTACWFGNMQELNFFRTTLCVFHNSCWHCYGPTSFCLLNAVTFIMFTAWDFMLMWT